MRTVAKPVELLNTNTEEVKQFSSIYKAVQYLMARGIYKRSDPGNFKRLFVDLIGKCEQDSDYSRHGCKYRWVAGPSSPAPTGDDVPDTALPTTTYVDPNVVHTRGDGYEATHIPPSTEIGHIRDVGIDGVNTLADDHSTGIQEHHEAVPPGYSFVTPHSTSTEDENDTPQQYYTFSDEVDALFSGKQVRVTTLNNHKFISLVDLIKAVCSTGTNPRKELINLQQGAKYYATPLVSN